MDRKNLIALIAGSLAALLLICILLVGVLDGIWPWDGVTAYGRLITSRTQATVGPKETTEPTEETTGNQQGAASGEQQEEPKPTVGEIGQQPVPPTLPDEEDDIKTEIGGVVIPPQGSTDPTQGSTDSSTGPTEETPDKELSGSDIAGW